MHRNEVAQWLTSHRGFYNLPLTSQPCRFLNLFCSSGSWWSYSFFHPHTPQPDPLFFGDSVDSWLSCFATLLEMTASFRCTISSWIFESSRLKLSSWGLETWSHFAHIFVPLNASKMLHITLLPEEPTTNMGKNSCIFKYCMLFLKTTFLGMGFHHLLLEILAGWWLFPGLTRQASVNSARAAWSGGQSCWSMGRQQWLWHTGWWRVSFFLSSLNVFLPF